MSDQDIQRQIAAKHDAKAAHTFAQEALAAQSAEASEAPSSGSTNWAPLAIGVAVVAAIAMVVMWSGGMASSSPAPGTAGKTPAPQQTQAVQQQIRHEVPVMAGEPERSRDGMFGITMVQVRTLRTTSSTQISENGASLTPTSDTEMVSGVRVVSVQTPEASWLKLGAAVGDIIISYQGVPVTYPDVVNQVHARQKAGDVVTVVIERGGKLLTLTGLLGTVEKRGALP